MNKFLIYKIVIICIAFCSLTSFVTNILMISTWGIRLGKKELLASWKNNKMGDTAILETENLKSSDTIFVQQFLCGQSGQNAITTLTIKNSQNEIIKESINIHNGFMFSAKMPLSDILNSTKIKENKLLAIYFSISSKDKKINQSNLLGSIRLK